MNNPKSIINYQINWQIYHELEMLTRRTAVQRDGRRRRQADDDFGG